MGGGQKTPPKPAPIPEPVEAPMAKSASMKRDMRRSGYAQTFTMDKSEGKRLLGL
jgi:hypothetical protein